MRRFLFLLVLAVALPVHGAGRKPVLLDAPSAFVLPRGQLETALFIEKVNETIDIFDVKGSQLSDLRGRTDLDLGAIGDLDGFRAVVGLGLGHRSLFQYVGRRQDIAFGAGTLERAGDELHLRYVVHRGREDGTTLALEPIFRSNRGSGIARTFTRFEAFGVIIVPPQPIRLEFGGAKDESYALRLSGTRQLFDHGLLSMWTEFERVSVESELRTNLPLVELQRILGALEYESSQWHFGIGVNWQFSGKFAAHVRYERLAIDRDINDRIPGVVDTNDIVRARFDYAILPEWTVNLQFDYFGSQLGGEVPFLFNELSASRFDKVYGYAGLGVTHRVDFGD
ncbi:MAG: hypothetical protein HY816_11645 [Candidatus Wallbacteria bacterium]|nr:hypothetical protein [Candidatus Wallbacteria bacterium]